MKLQYISLVDTIQHTTDSQLPNMSTWTLNDNGDVTDVIFETGRWSWTIWVDSDAITRVIVRCKKVNGKRHECRDFSKMHGNEFSPQTSGESAILISTWWNRFCSCDLQKGKVNKMWVLSHSIYSNLLWQPYKTNITGI